VVVTLVDGGDQLRHCLTALAKQAGAPPLEVLIPYDDSVGDLAALRNEFSGFQFIALGPVATERRSASAAGQHELFDRRRAAALAVATGEIVAMLEDRGVPRPEWAATLCELHRRHPHEVIGGAVDWAGQGVLSWAVYACDFGRYASVHPEGSREFLTDCNLSYKRRALDATRSLWRERYHETQVHDQLRRDGVVLWFSPDAVVEEARAGLRLAPLLTERIAWGRLYGAIRLTGAPTGRRWLQAMTAAVLPLLLYWRIVRRHAGRTPGRLVMATPALLLLLAAWTLGECAGYLTGEP
jgi:hypothetical protein